MIPTGTINAFPPSGDIFVTAERIAFEGTAENNGLGHAIACKAGTRGTGRWKIAANNIESNVGPAIRMRADSDYLQVISATIIRSTYGGNPAEDDTGGGLAGYAFANDGACSVRLHSGARWWRRQR